MLSDVVSIKMLYFIMLRVSTLGSHSEFLPVIQSLSPQDCSSVECVIGEGHVQSLTGQDPGEILQLKGRSR